MTTNDPKKPTDQGKDRRDERQEERREDKRGRDEERQEKGEDRRGERRDERGGEHPDNTLPPGSPGAPDNTLPGTPGRPDQGLPGGERPTDPDYGKPEGGRPDQGLPGTQPGPDNSLPGTPGRPDQGLPGSQPGPDNTLPGTPGAPDQSLPGSQPAPDQGLPPGAPTRPDNELPESVAPKGENPKPADLYALVSKGKKIEIAFFDDRYKPIQGLPPQQIAGGPDVWLAQAGGFKLNVPDFMVYGHGTGPSGVGPNYSIAAYALLVDGRQVAFKPRPSPLNITPGMTFQLKDDVIF